MTDDATRYQIIERLLWETRASLEPIHNTDEHLQLVNGRVNALLDELERMAAVPNLPPRFK